MSVLQSVLECLGLWAERCFLALESLQLTFGAVIKKLMGCVGCLLGMRVTEGLLANST